MPTLSRFFLRAALLYLAAALLLALIRAWPTVAPSAATAVGPVSTHFLMVGWVTQMIFGVAYWMLPRPGPDRAFGSPTAGWAGFATLNTGLLLRAVAEPAVALGAAGWPRVALLSSALLQLVGVTTMVALLWRRLEER